MKFSFRSLTTRMLPIMLSHQAFALVLSWIVEVFDRCRSSHPHLWLSVKVVNIVCVDDSGFSGISFAQWLKPATEWGNQRPPSIGHQFGYDCGPVDSITRDPSHFGFTAKLSGFKRFRIQSSHFKFRIQNLRRHGQTGKFLYRIRPLVCKRQNQAGVKTFRIRHESGTISSNVSLVWILILIRS